MGPVGAIITVKTGDVLTLDQDNVRALRTVIETGAVLEVDPNKQGHRLGIVLGTGTIKVSNDAFPSGYYESFLSCSGGGIEYSGSTDYDVLGSISNVRNVLFTGTGKRRMPNNNVSVCEDMIINGPDVEHDASIDVEVQDDFILQSGTFTFSNGADIEITDDMSIAGNLSGSEDSKVLLAGDLTYTSGTLDMNGMDFTFNGSTPQLISGTFKGTAAFDDLQVNNLAGIDFTGGTKLVSNKLKLTKGLIRPGSDSLLLDADAKAVPPRGKSNSYVRGKLHKIIPDGDGFIFPIGKGPEWRHVSVLNVNSNGSDFIWTAEYFNSGPTGHADVNNTTPKKPGINVNPNEYWQIDDNGPDGGATAHIGLSWRTNSGFGSSTNFNNMKIMSWNKTDQNWDDTDGSSDSGPSSSEGFATASNSLTFSGNTVTTGSEDVIALPIELMFFTGKIRNNEVHLSWSTASENNNDRFEIEKSDDGLHFATIGTVSGRGTTSSINEYGFVDRDWAVGKNYYRLKQIDYDEAYEFSNVVLVNMAVLDLDKLDFSLYPNPTNGEMLDVDFAQNVSGQLMIMNLSGNTVLNLKIEEENFISLSTELLQSGIYIIHFHAGDQKIYKKIIVN